jgi:SpoVK/Ycf46/Vps4 family AAA+-type ATPase
VDDVIASLRAAVESSPADVPLRIHLGELLLDAGRIDEAVREAAEALRLEPTSEDGHALMHRAINSNGQNGNPSAERDTSEEADFDWHAAEEDIGPIAPPMFVEGNSDEGASEAWDVERVQIGLDDVGGMEHVKERLEVSFLAPLRNPDLRRLYGKSLRGGLLLYGPPGCGKSYIARALAGEMKAGFISVSIHDVLDMWIGSSERNLHNIFAQARRNAPCVVFIDELDALGRRRSHLSSEAMRPTVNQLLAELDGLEANNDGVYALAATNHPWDIDVALRRPGRFDRLVLVLPPDLAAREAIFRAHLEDRPVAGIDLGALARKTEGLSGARACVDGCGPER